MGNIIYYFRLHKAPSNLILNGFWDELLEITTSLCQCVITRNSVLMSNPFHDLTGQWGEAERSVVSRVLAIKLFKKGCYAFLFSSHWGLYLTAVTFQKQWRVAWQLQLQNFLRTLGFISLGPMDLLCPGSSGGLESDLFLTIGGTSFLQSLPHLI